MKEQDLRIIFQESLEGIIENSQIKYLVTEYLEIEKMWTSFLNSLEIINLVLVAEAPLNSNQYILNKTAKNTSFLYKSTLEKCMNAYRNDIHKYETTKIDLMRDLGIIVIEAYPYSLDPKKHKNNFGNLTLQSRKVLLNQSCSWHLDKKLETIKVKTTKKTIFGYRYNRNKDFINLIDTDLKFVNLSDAGKKPAYGSIDEDKLIKIFTDLSI